MNAESIERAVTSDSNNITTISKLLTPKEVAKILHVTTGTLAVWRSSRRRPLAFVKPGWRVFYREEAVQAFILRQEDPGDGKKPRRLRKVRG
jgi:hypothetical protein